MKKIITIIIVSQIIALGFLTFKISTYIKSNIYKENIPQLNDNSPHPYLGYITNRNKFNNINDFGFLGPNPYQKKSKNSIIIGIFGGSVANNYWIFEHDHLINQLKKITQFKNYHIRFINLSSGGYKQPQQLITLSYLLSLGSEFDIIINIDGFNEVALPYAENIPNNISSFYPSYWGLLSQNSLNFSIKSQVFIIHLLKQIANHPITPKNINILLNKINEKQQIILYYLLSKEVYRFHSIGPEKVIASNIDEINQNIVDVWANSSIQMNNLAKSNQSLYLHFLQPNQYYLQSKTLTNTEKKLLIILTILIKKVSRLCIRP